MEALEQRLYFYDGKEHTFYEWGQILHRYARMIDKHERQIVYYESMGERGKSGLAKANDMYKKWFGEHTLLKEWIDGVIGANLASMPKSETRESNLKFRRRKPRNRID